MSNPRQKYFYSGVVDISSISIEIADMDMTPEERKHLIALAESNVHHKVLDTILSELSEEDKKKFLQHVNEDNHENIWNLLKEKVDNIEDKIRSAAEELKAELHKDIEETKKKK